MRRSVIVLCEDEQHSAFIRRFPRKKSWQLVIDASPPGAGAGEQYVREEYPKQLEVARKKNSALVVMIDGDSFGVARRMRQLEKSCREQGVNKPGKAEPVAVFVPDPDIEAWICYLDGSKAGKLPRASECASAVRKLADICAGGDTPGNLPPSLDHACEEWKRFRKKFD